MGTSGIIKRVVPFIVTVIIGLFIASFFVTLSAPKVEVERSWRSSKHRSLKMENRRLKRKIRRYECEKRKHKKRRLRMKARLDVPPPPPPPPVLVAPVPPPPPPAPVAPEAPGK